MLFFQAGLRLNQYKEMIFRKLFSTNLPEYFGTVKRADCIRILGVILTDKLSWSSHLSDVVKHAFRRMFIIHCLRSTLSGDELITVYRALNTPLFLYASLFFDNVSQSFFLI